MTAAIPPRIATTLRITSGYWSGQIAGRFGAKVRRRKRDHITGTLSPGAGSLRCRHPRRDGRGGHRGGGLVRRPDRPLRPDRPRRAERPRLGRRADRRRLRARLEGRAGGGDPPDARGAERPARAPGAVGVGRRGGAGAADRRTSRGRRAARRRSATSCSRATNGARGRARSRWTWRRRWSGSCGMCDDFVSTLRSRSRTSARARGTPPAAAAPRTTSTRPRWSRGSR